MGSNSEAAPRAGGWEEAAGGQDAPAPTQLQLEFAKRLPGFDLRPRLHSGPGTLVLFGPSGSGKSLTLAAIAGLLRPDDGRIVLGGETLFDSTQRVDLPPERRRVGYVPQGYALFPHLTVEANVAYGLHAIDRDERRQRVAEALALLGLAELAERTPRQISGGQQQRVALARALVIRPRALLLDEPFAALDAEIRRALRAELAALQRRLGIAVIFVTHDLAEAHAVGDTVALYDAGAVLQVGPTADVFARPASRRAAELTATRNILPATVVDATTVRLGPNCAETPPHDLPPGTAVHLCIRPEHVLLVRPGSEPHVAERHNVLRATIEREVASGAFHTLFLRAGDLLLEADVPAHPYEVMGVARSREWDVSLKRSAIHLIRLSSG